MLRQSLFCGGLILVAIGPIASVKAAPEATSLAPARCGDQLSLDGQWQVGIDRHYDREAPVPGLEGNPAEMAPGTVWYRRTVHLPGGDWTHATLLLGGARFAPAVWVDGRKVASAEGGMAPIGLDLASPHVRPGATITLEIALQSLRDLNPQDASAVPEADRWRADVSSELWDSVVLHFSGAAHIARVVPWADFFKRQIAVHWTLRGDASSITARTVQAVLVDGAGRVVARSAPGAAAGNTGVVMVPLGPDVRPWTPDAPEVYRLHVSLQEGDRQVDAIDRSWGLRDFRTQGLRFMLNGAPLQLRGATVVWHRWVRDPQARTVAWDAAWFDRNIVERLKGLGANFLRFHLGLPPERLLDLCDRRGLMVQMEWPFFHDVTASPASMRKQWRAWLDVAVRHPCVVIVQAWNEINDDELKSAWTALDSVLPEYPPLVVSHRDEIPVHKYWWSLFENLGLYYDSAAQFGRPIMVDEFGGNYLDYHGGFGAYVTVRESFLRFLGRNSTPERRLRFQAEACAKVAEYWRRLGAAGFAPFCALSSPEDGNTWFLDSLAHPRPKPVWAALAAAYAPQSVSLEIWDRNFTPGQSIHLPVYFFNDGGEAQTLTAVVRVVSPDGVVKSQQTVEQAVPAHATRTRPVDVVMPAEVGPWRLEGELVQPARRDGLPIVSSWDIRTVDVAVPVALKGTLIGVPEDESELRAFLAQNHLNVTSAQDPRASVLLLSARSWPRLKDTPEWRNELQAAVQRGQSLVLLDIGPRNLGQGYKKGELGPLEGAPQVKTPQSETDDLFSGIKVTFIEVAEPESHFHPAANNADLWRGLPRESTWLWNGLRGGLVAPADDMEVTGLAPSALVSQWVERGADEARLRGNGEYYAYQLAGYYAFSTLPHDADVESKLRERVRFLAEDAPALQDRINPNAPVQVTDLHRAYRLSRSGGLASALIPLANCGKNLARTPVVELTFGPGRGKVILSQLLTAGRLRRGESEPGLYGIRYDPVADQFVLNMLAQALAKAP